MNEYENKIELMNYLNVLWKRKWMIIIATFLFIAAAVVTNPRLPQKWEVDAIFVPSKYYYRNIEGIWQEMQFVSSSAIVNAINQAAYNEEIATEISLDLKDFPKLTAATLKNTYQIRVSIKDNDVEKAKLILNSYCNFFKNMCDISANRRMNRFNSQIKSKETEKLMLERKIKTYKKKLDIIKQRKQEIEKDRSEIRKNIEELKKEHSLMLKKKNRSESENITLLHYSNEIQHNSMNYSILNESLGNKKIEEEIINLEIEDKERLINQREKEINSIKEDIFHIYYAQIIKEPTSSISPQSPPKLYNVLIAGILGFIIFTMFAFFLEYIKKQKTKSKG
jgi:uncharacterized protein involved in exopolysaccharide biosynthesis